jgi:hypothetical protein
MPVALHCRPATTREKKRGQKLRSLKVSSPPTTRYSRRIGSDSGVVVPAIFSP